MTIPYTLVIIKPLSVGRGHGPEILQKLLENCHIALRMFRVMTICDTTLQALVQDTHLCESNLDYEAEKIHPPRHVNSWICVFTHIDRKTDPTRSINTYCGPLPFKKWVSHHLRYQYGTNTHPSDSVVHVSKPDRVNYESNLLFMNFTEDDI